MLTNRPIRNIRDQIAEAAGKRKKNPLKANKYGKELYADTHDILPTLKDILSTSSEQYKNISDAVADEIESCYVDFFNKNRESENNIDPGNDALKLAKYADSIAIDTRRKDRINKWLPMLEKWIEDRPVREQRKKAELHMDYIVKQLKGLPDLDRISPSEIIIADSFLDDCTKSLNSLKSIFWAKDEKERTTSDFVKSIFDDLGIKLPEKPIEAEEINLIPSTIILEQFENNENKWGENEEGNFFRKIQDGKYILQSTNEKNGHWSWGVNHLDFGKFCNFTFECSITKIKGADNIGFGILWSYQKKTDNIHNFRFCISGDGHYYFKELYNQEWVGGFQWSASDHIVRGNETNVLKVCKHDNSVTFYINGKLIVIGEKMAGENMTGNGIGFDVAQDMTIGINYLYFCNADVSDFSIISDRNYYMRLSSAVASRALDFCIAYADRTHDMEGPIMLMNKIRPIDMKPESRMRFVKNEGILRRNEARTPPVKKLFNKVRKWLE